MSSFDDKHPGLKNFIGLHTGEVFSQATFEEAVAATQIDKQKIKETIDVWLKCEDHFDENLTCTCTYHNLLKELGL